MSVRPMMANRHGLIVKRNYQELVPQVLNLPVSNALHGPQLLGPTGTQTAAKCSDFSVKFQNFLGVLHRTQQL